MSRLKSFSGPSSPSPNPVRGQSSPINGEPPTSPKPNQKSRNVEPVSPPPRNAGGSPATRSVKKKPRRDDQDYDSLYALNDPSHQTPPTETTYHRKLRKLLLEFRAAVQIWNDLVLVDGVKAAKTLIDARTELSNAIGALPPGTQPRSRIITPKLTIMDQKIQELDSTVKKLAKQFNKMCSMADSADVLLIEAIKAKGIKWVNSEPLWTTWSLDKFVSTLPTLLPLFHRALATCEDIVKVLRPHSISFEDSRIALKQWAAQSCVSDSRWQDWEDLLIVEVTKLAD